MTDQQGADRQRPEMSEIEAAADITRRTTSERVVDFFQRRSAFALIFLAAAILSASAIIGAAVVSLHHWYDVHFRWQPAIETTLTDLQAGYSLHYFEAELGSPIISRAVDKGYEQQVFKGRGFYVLTLTKGGSEVDFYEVTTCNTSLHPRFIMPGVGSVTLNKSTFSQVSQTADYDYYHGGFGLDGAPFMREYIYGALQGSYRTFMWGINPSCDNLGANVYQLERRLPDPLAKVKPTGSELRWVRSHAVADEYGVTAPNVLISELPEQSDLDEITVSLGNPTFGRVNWPHRLTPCVTPDGPAPGSKPTCGTP